MNKTVVPFTATPMQQDERKLLVEVDVRVLAALIFGIAGQNTAIIGRSIQDRSTATSGIAEECTKLLQDSYVEMSKKLKYLLNLYIETSKEA